MIGEETGRKAIPAEASARMRTVRTEEGARIFGKDEWLTPQYVNSYFSRLAAMKIIDQQPAALVNLEEEDDEAIVESSEKIPPAQKKDQSFCPYI